MDIQDPPELGPALLRWISSFPFGRTVRSWKDLQDGSTLWRVLQEVEPSYFTGDLPEEISSSENWIPRWQNLKHINRLTLNFIRDECGKLQELSKMMNPDLKSMAIDASPAASQQLVKAVLLAALYYPESNQRMLGDVIDQLGTKASIAIANCVNQMETMDKKLVDSVAHTDTESDIERMSSPEPDRQSYKQFYRRDPDLEHEEKLITAYTRIKKLEEACASLTFELEQSRKDVTELETDVQDLRHRLEHGQSADDEVLEHMRQRSDQDKDNIAQLEAELMDARSEIEGQEKQLDKLYRELEAYQRLQDEVHSLRTEREESKQLAKAHENLKKKIQALQDSDKSSEGLREQMASAQQELQSLRPLKQKVATLQRHNEENAKIIQNGEQEIFDQKTTRRRLDHELRILTRQVESAKERHKQDQDAIRELEEKNRDFESGTAGTSKAPETLDVEFSSEDRAFNELQARNAELEAENIKLREAQVVIPDEPITDQSAYEMLKARCDKLEKQYLDVYQENLGLEYAAQAIQVAGVLESRPFIEMRDRLKDESEQRALAEKKLFEIEAELSDAKLRLQAVAGDDKDAPKFASEESKILHEENSRLLGHIRTFEGDLDEHRSLLRHALLDKDALLKQDKDSRFQDELKLITEQLRAVADDPSRTDDMAVRLTKRIEDSRLQTTTVDAQLAAERDSHKVAQEDFKVKLEQAEGAAARGAETAGQESLLREVNFMTTAWYDITKRMQSDAVVVQRRTEAPRSFLNRQRKLVNSAILPQKR